MEVGAATRCLDPSTLREDEVSGNYTSSVGSEVVDPVPSSKDDII